MSFKIPIEVSERVSKILIDTKMNKKAEASVEVFKLDRVYQSNLDEVPEIKEMLEKYSELK